MSGKFSRWLRSRAGTGTIIGVLAVLLVIGIVGQLLGWWAALADLLSGAAVEPPPPPSYPPPVGGYTCLPTCNDGVTDYNGDGVPEPQDGKFLSQPGEQMASFGGSSITVWIAVPADYQTFEIGIFDGDSGKDTSGVTGPYWNGNWDNTTTQSTYTLYTDPLEDGPTDGEIQLGLWKGNDANPTTSTYCTALTAAMPNNGWYTLTCKNVPEARGASGHYFYRLEATRPVQGHGFNAYKLRSNAYLSTGNGNSNLSVVAPLISYSDFLTLYPNFSGDWANLGQSAYNGAWDFYFYVPPPEWPTTTVTVEIWDGDFDRGTSTTEAIDEDDFNTPNTLPPFQSPNAQPEGVGGTYRGRPGMGDPADDFVVWPMIMREPPVVYVITDPSGQPIYTNENPSGTEEWEKYVISTDPNVEADQTATALRPGWYGWHIEGLDINNTVWIRFNSRVVPIPPPPPCQAECPRTIGYWKNNVRKWLEAAPGTTPNGIQETRESLLTALNLAARYSGFYCNGMDVRNPVVMSPCNPLTLQEANVILQRDKRTYPGGRDAANSMLARALQQNLATWLNMMSGKICLDTHVVINVPNGTFEGSLWDALQKAREIILNKDSARMEWAKDIADLINNAQINVDPSDALACSAYNVVVPPDKQPPPYNELPVAPTPVPPPPPVITCTAGEEGCPVCTGNPCDSIFSPGYWKNYSNHYTDAEFLALIQKTAHYSGLTIDEALAILNNNSDQYHRHLLSAELNVAANPGLGVGTYNSGSISNALVFMVLDQAYNTDPANADADLSDAVLYLGAGGEGQGSGACRVTCSTP